MIRTTVYAWLSSLALVFGAAVVAPGLGPAPPSPSVATGRPSAPTIETVTPAAQVSPKAAQPRIVEQFERPSETAVGMLPDRQLSDVPPPAPVPTPVSVQFDGVSPSQIVGDRVNLSLTTAGNVRSYVWTVMPPGTIGLKVYDGGSKADFTSRFPGTYVFLVAVAGGDGSVAQAYHSLELRSDYAPSPAAATAAVPTPEVSDPSVLVRKWAAEVQSPNRRSEQLLVASAFRQAAGAIDGGMISGRDLLAQTKSLCALSLGGALGAWTPWFEKVEQLYREFERLKVLSTPANYSAANKSVARALESME